MFEKHKDIFYISEQINSQECFPKKSLHVTAKITKNV